MSRTPAETDPFFQLLSDALRAGPGSAQWGEAVAKLRDGGVEGADEYRLIIRAREDLEKGREFRRVSAGPGFTRKVLEAVEQEGGRKHNGIPTATIVAVLAGLVILAVIVTTIVLMSRGGGGAVDAREAAIKRLEATSFPVAVTSASFVREPQASTENWRNVGQLPLDRGRGMTAGMPKGATTAPTTQSAAATVGGAVVTVEPLPAGASAAIEAEVELPAAGPHAGEPLTQVFVSDSSDFAPATATSPREIVWTYRAGRMSVDAGGSGPQQSLDLSAAGKAVKLSIRFDERIAIVEADGRRVYAGPHGLTPGASRYVGVRFIRAAGESGPSAALRSVNVSRAAPAGGQ
jgi:hypothetical protein